MGEYQATVGRIVHYVLSDQDAVQIAQRVSTGNTHRAGDVLPAIAVRVWDNGAVNLKVFLDGPEDHWATSRMHGLDDQQGTWH